MKLWKQTELEEGIKKASEELSIDEVEEFMDITLDEVEQQVKSAAIALDEDLVKSADLDETAETVLDQYLIKSAHDAHLQMMEKVGVIKEENCTDSEGNKGNYVLYDSKGEKKLGCHKTKAQAKDQEQAIQVRKHGELLSKEADMPAPESKGHAGRQALAERFYAGGEFDHSACVAAIRDEGFTDDPHAYCRALARLVGRGREATRGEREGKQPGE